MCARMWIPWQKWGRTKASHGLGSQNVARSSTCKTLVIHQKRRSERTPPQPLSQAFAFFTSNTALGLNHLNFPRPFMFVEDLYMGMGRFQACSPDQCTMDKQRRRFVHPVGRRVGLLVLTHWHNMICRHQLFVFGVFSLGGSSAASAQHSFGPVATFLPQTAWSTSHKHHCH